MNINILIKLNQGDAKVEKKVESSGMNSVTVN